MVAFGLVLIALGAGSPVAGKPKVLWDGKTEKVAVGWVAPGGDDQRAIVPSQPGVAEFQLARKNAYVEAGLQWAPWNPEFTGTDFRGYKSIQFSLQVTGTDRPEDLLLSLRSPGDHNCTGNVGLKAVVPNVLHGKWHKVRVSLADLEKADRKFLAEHWPGSKYDPSHVIQIILGAWNPKGTFTLRVRDVSLLR
ncbi:MAG: hypothetical protein ACOYON_07900 [Fimbriimonas sp.]